MNKKITAILIRTHFENLAKKERQKIRHNFLNKAGIGIAKVVKKESRADAANVAKDG